jgi:hypothetical protein
MRGLNLAGALRSLVPSTRSVFFTLGQPPNGIGGPDVEFVPNVDAANGPGRWPGLVADLAPDAIVYDTMLPEGAGSEAAPSSTTRVYVMRRCKPERQAAIFASPALRRMDLVVVPHAEREFGYRIPTAIADRATFVGPIVRTSNADARSRILARYRIEPGDFLLTSTPGGGGFTEDARRFFDLTFRVHRILEPRIRSFRHVLALGPRFPERIAAPDGVTVVGCEPDLVDLLAVSDAVVSAGGYNTVNELRVAGAAAILIPCSRTHDDQRERVEHLARRGHAYIPRSEEPERMAEEIAGVCVSPERLATMRRRLAASSPTPGNLDAARAIHAVIDRKRVDR